MQVKEIGKFELCLHVLRFRIGDVGNQYNAVTKELY